MTLLRRERAARLLAGRDGIDLDHYAQPCHEWSWYLAEADRQLPKFKAWLIEHFGHVPEWFYDSPSDLTAEMMRRAIPLLQLGQFARGADCACFDDEDPAREDERADHAAAKWLVILLLGWTAIAMLAGVGLALIWRV